VLLVGLTGGIASGKSLVAKVFSSLGAHIIDADQIVHELLAPHQETWHEIIQYFGNTILLPNLDIDRKKLGALVFKDADKRAWLNACLHPRVFSLFSSRVKQLQEAHPDAIVIFDAALLIETGYYKNMNKIVVVYTNKERQVDRLAHRDGFSSEQALDRIQSQMPLSEKLRYADYVIKNTSSMQNAEVQASAVFASLKRDAERINRGNSLS